MLVDFAEIPRPCFRDEFAGKRGFDNAARRKYFVRFGFGRLADS
jgi:hypothetical protein